MIKKVKIRVKKEKFKVYIKIASACKGDFKLYAGTGLEKSDLSGCGAQNVL